MGVRELARRDELGWARCDGATDRLSGRRRCSWPMLALGARQNHAGTSSLRLALGLAFGSFAAGDRAHRAKLGCFKALTPSSMSGSQPLTKPLLDVSRLHTN